MAVALVLVPLELSEERLAQPRLGRYKRPLLHRSLSQQTHQRHECITSM